MSAGTSVRLIGPYYKLSQTGGRFWCVANNPVRVFTHPVGKIPLPRDAKDKLWGVGPSRLLYQNSQSKFALWNIDSKKTLHEGAADPETEVHVSLDGEWYTYEAKSLRLVLRASTGEMRMQTDLSKLPVFSKEGSLMALWVSNVHRVGGSLGWVRIMDLERKAMVNFDLGSPARSLYFLNEDELIAQDEQNKLLVFSRSKRECVREKAAPGHTLIGAAGDRLLVSVDADPLRHRVIDANSFQVTADLADSRSPTFSGDGVLIAYHRIEPKCHKLCIVTAADAQQAAEFVVRDEAFDEYDPELEMQLAFHSGGRQVAAMVNGEELHVWSLAGGQWREERLAPATGQGKDAYISLDALDQTLNLATSAIRGIGGFFSKVVKQKTEENKAKPSGPPHWLRAAGMTFPTAPEGAVLPESAEASLAWLRARKDRFQKRGPDVLPRSLKGLNNRALRARIALNQLEPFLVIVEESAPPYKLSMDEMYKCLGAVDAFLEAHPRGSTVCLQLFGFLELLTREDFTNRKAAAAIYAAAGLSDFEAFLSDMADPEEEKRKALEKARSVVNLADELELWVIPDFSERAGLEPDEAQALEVALRSREEELITACARVGTFNRKVREERIQWIVDNILARSDVVLSGSLKQKLEGSFRTDL